MFLYYKKVMNLIELPQKFAELAKPDLAKKIWFCFLMKEKLRLMSFEVNFLFYGYLLFVQKIFHSFEPYEETANLVCVFL